MFERRKSLLKLFGFKITALENIKRAEVIRIQFGRLLEVGNRARKIILPDQRSGE